MFGWLRGCRRSTYWPRVREATSGVEWETGVVLKADGRVTRRQNDFSLGTGDGTSSPITTESSEILRERNHVAESTPLRRPRIMVLVSRAIKIFQCLRGKGISPYLFQSILILSRYERLNNVIKIFDRKKLWQINNICFRVCYYTDKI